MNILKHIPGFRTGRKWKMVIAIIYYLIALSGLTENFNTFVMLFIIPFMIFSIVDIFRLRKYWKNAREERGNDRKNVNLVTIKIIGFLMIFILSIATLPSDKINNNVISTNKNGQAVTSSYSKNSEKQGNNTDKKQQNNKIKQQDKLSNKKQKEINSQKQVKENIKEQNDNINKEKINITPKASTYKEEEKTTKTVYPKNKKVVKNDGSNVSCVKNESKSTISKSIKKGRQVWLSETGSKYHSIPNCGRMNPNKARKVSIEEAKSQGYEPCSKCM